MSGILQGLLASINAPAGPWLYAWGSSFRGQLGDNTRVNKSSPVQIGDLTNWSQVDGGYYQFSAAIKTNGTIWTWGFNGNGQLGDNSVDARSSPVQVGALTNWSKVACGEQFISSIKTDGTLWAWGKNGFGQLGDNTTVGKSSPIQIGALTNWSKVACDKYFCAAIKTDGTLWTWGRNENGELGLDLSYANLGTKSSPTQVGALTNWSKVVAGGRFCISIKTDGTLWSWGRGSQGQLGINTPADRSSPVQIGALTNWSEIAATDYTCAAIKTDGTLWTWGKNTYGELGNSGVLNVNVSSPVQVGSLTDWSKAYGGKDFFASIKTNKTLWTWGRNNVGQLGDDTVISKSSPIQVGSGTWSTAACGGNFILAIED